MVYDDSQTWKDVGEDLPNMTIYYSFLLLKKSSLAEAQN